MKTSLFSLLMVTVGLITSAVIVCSALRRRDVLSDFANSLLDVTDVAERLRKKDNDLDPERAFEKTKVKDNAGGLGEAIKTGPAAIGILINIDYKQDDTMQTVKEVGDALVPFIAAGLALIPGVGPIIGGVFAGVWGLLSPFLGGDGKSPVEKLQEKLTQEVDALHRKIDDLRRDMTDQFKKEREKTRIETQRALGQLVADGVHGEMVRNNYICQKYSIVSVEVADALWQKQKLNRTVKIDMKSKMDSCDNFLKDTSMVFAAHPQYAEVLWVASAFTTLIRVAFLTEAANYGPKVGVSERLIDVYKAEATSDLRKQYAFFAKGMYQRVSTLWHPETAVNFTEYEYEACRIQSRLPYFDRERYPYGVPEYTTISERRADVDLTQLFNLNDKPEKHFQIFYDDKDHSSDSRSPRVLNCNMGPLWISPFFQADADDTLDLNLFFLAGKMYEVRLLSFSTTFQNSTAPIFGSIDWQEILALPGAQQFGRGVTVHDRSNGKNDDLAITIGYSPSTEERKGVRFAYDSVYVGAKCSSSGVDNNSVVEKCAPNLRIPTYGGVFSVDTIGKFDFVRNQSPAASGNKIKARVSINLEANAVVLFFGLEVIMTSS